MTVTPNRRKGCFDINLKYGERKILVSLKPIIGPLLLECVDVREQGKIVRGDEAHRFSTDARREFAAVLRTWLRSKPRHVKVATVAERVELSFALTLQKLNKAQRLSLGPLSVNDLTVLQHVARDIVDEMVRLKEQARREQRTLYSGYLDDIKAGVLKQWSKEIILTSERRTFYSSVLGRAFAWKQGNIPYEHYTEAMKYLPGIKLAMC